MMRVGLQGLRGGVGTTSIVAGLAYAAWQQGARVLVVELNREGQLGLHFGLPYDTPGGWSVLRHPEQEWRQALHHCQDGLDLLLHGGEEGAYPWLEQLDGYDLLLLDLPRSQRIPHLDRYLTVVNADANCHVRLYQHEFVPNEQVLVTQFTSRRALQQDLLELWLDGGVPLLSIRLHRDEAMAESLAAKQPVGQYQPESLIASELVALAHWCLESI
ncbi:cellulose synthase operon protein YhjQ/BcsQ [Aeromonas simiae]|uniref:cellulose synthase operon protein YhjQ/BcsQ n=1 Tax=Aeromonas simiae TaxID=218936 RepID=UPI0005AB31AB|nr:cellulose synthase operon protein YhjQ/BcsQ [Aeromonas simiae]